MKSLEGSEELASLDEQLKGLNSHGPGGSNSVNPSAGWRSGLTSGKLGSVILNALKPEILQRRKSGSRRPLRPTAWLDGLRGWAAFVVCFVHLTVYTHSQIELCYGAAVEPGKFNITPAAWPVVRILFSGGHFAVMLFFTISGYVLPRRMISLLHEGRKDDFIEAVNSAIVRRPFRLYLPVVWSTLGFLLSWHLLGIVTPWPPRQANVFAELWAWFRDMLRFFYFYRMGLLFTYYNIHSWTIVAELRGSMFIYIWLFALHQISNRLRILLTFGMTLYLAIGSAGAWFACFFAGMLTAELDLLDEQGSTRQIKLPWDGFFKKLRQLPILRHLLLHTILLCGLYLGGEPSADELWKEDVLDNCRGWKTLSYLIPTAYNDKPASTHRWYWLFWASWMILVSVKEIDPLRWFFETSVSQYLGRHSFALYLTHGPMIGILSERLFYLTGVKQVQPGDLDAYVRYGPLANKWSSASWWPFPNTGPSGLEPNFLFCAFISIIVFLYVAEVGTKLFDTPSVHASNWVWAKLKKMR